MIVSVPPKILTPMKEMKLKEGDKLHLDIKFEGAPTPSITWTVNGKPVSTDMRGSRSDYDDHTIVNIVDVKRPDAGEYKLHLKNEYGEDSGTLKLVVLAPPGPPEGPLNVDEIGKDRCTLSWKPPKDNGGSDIT